MDTIEFGEDLETKIAEIDEQHRKLVDIYNELVEAKHAGHGNRMMAEILAHLFQYTKDHFAFEERMLRDRGYENFVEHRALHEDLLKSLRKYVFRHTKNGERITREMVDFVGDWITRHIRVEDMKYAVALQERTGDTNSVEAREPAVN